MSFPSTSKIIQGFVLTFLLFFVVLLTTPFGYAGSEDSEEILELKDQYFVCTIVGKNVSCNPSVSDFETFLVSLETSPIVGLFNPEVEYVEGQTGMALNLIANKRESVEIVNNPSINPSQFSISFWVKGHHIPEGLGHAISHVSRTLDAGWLVYASKDLEGKEFLTFGVTNHDGRIIIPSKVEINPESFDHLVGTFDGKNVSIYVNGNLVDTVEYSGNYNSDPGLPLRFGSASFSKSTLRWSGALDEVVFFGNALSSEEVKQLFLYHKSTENKNQPKSGENIRGEWNFEGTLDDISSNRNDGHMITLLGSMVFDENGRLFFTEKNTGYIKIIKDGKILEKPFAWVPDLYVDWEQGLLGITLDDDFENNKFLYVYHTAIDIESGKIFNRVVRFTDQNGEGVNMKILMEGIPGTRGYHSGGALAIGPHDKKLYITVGDATEHIFAQDPNINIGKILRINKDGSIPIDNPSAESPIFTMGHRNIYGIAFDPDGFGLFTENGEFFFDEINLIKKGGNYGFPTHQPPNLPPELADPKNSVLPIRSYKHAIAPTQMIYYEGDKFPQIKGKFVYSAFTGDIYILTLEEKTGNFILFWR